MTFNAETRRRNAFIEASIAQTQELLDSPTLPDYLGQTMVAGLKDVGDRLFIPQVSNGEIKIPRKYKGSDGIPVLALREGDAELRWGSDFAHLYPRQRRKITQAMEKWGYNGPSLSAFIDAIELHSQDRLGSDKVVTDSYKDELVIGGPMARVSSLPSDFVFPTKYFSQMGRPDKLIMHRPLLTMRYAGPETPLTSQPTLGHEYLHALQYEALALHTDFQNPTRESRDKARRELEACFVGAGICHAMIDAGLEIDKSDISQIQLDNIRQKINSNRPKDPFNPNETLRAASRELGLGDL